MAQAMLKLENITKEYRVADTSVQALKGVSLSFRRKEFVSVLGHSGCQQQVCGRCPLQPGLH